MDKLYPSEQKRVVSLQAAATVLGGALASGRMNGTLTMENISYLTVALAKEFEDYIG